MPSSDRVLSVDDVHAFVEEHSFSAGSAGSADRVGVELEWLAFHLDRLEAYPEFACVRETARSREPLPEGGAVHFEPGGQVEVASAPGEHVAEVCRAASADAATVRAALSAEGITLLATGLDPIRPARRVLEFPRYRAMERYFDARSEAEGAAGRLMMGATAAVQVNVDGGSGFELAARWDAARRLGPILAAAFANSPFVEGLPSAWRSTRLQTWSELDPLRTLPVAPGPTPAAAWGRYALDAPVMLIRRSAEDFVPITEPLSFERWLDEGHELGYPTEEDFAYHLTTLFPPVRPRGWLELRMIDSLPEPLWQVAVAVATVLLLDPEARAAAVYAAAPAEGLWRDAAREALSHPVLAGAALRCFNAALEGVARLRGTQTLTGAIAAYIDRYIRPGTTPADEAVAAWSRSGSPIAPALLEPAWN
ncbi:MAG: glutamate-cysteine ligase family protein [Actinomycetota bacterium]